MDSEQAGNGGNVRLERCELCIVGAGIGGLNALFAASRHLSPRDRVLVVDRHQGAGGMWNATYDYVRLHQPHPMFTAGNIPWAGSRPPSHLASRDEVVTHLRSCFETLRQRLDLQLFGGYECRSHEEDTARGVVTLRCESVVPGGAPLRIEARRLIHAAGFGVQPQERLSLSSDQVRSLSPDRDALLGAEMAESAAPIYVVGGGKTAMDTAHALIQRFPGRRVRLLIGAGTLFMTRDDAFPTGLRRHYAGTVGVDTFRDLCGRFDGDNELQVMEHFRSRYAVGLDPRCRRHMFGLLSRHENETIRRGADAIMMDYLDDVLDVNGKPVLRLRGGAEHPVEPGSVFVNATGYFRESPQAYQPFMSASGRALAINPRSVLAFLPAYAGFLLAYAAYLDKLKSLPLYELDGIQLRERTPDAFMPTVGTHMLYNLSLLLSALPRAAQREFGVNTALWFPLHRQVLAGIRLMRFQKQHPDHLRKTLDRVRERFDLRLGPLGN